MPLHTMSMHTYVFMLTLTSSVAFSKIRDTLNNLILKSPQSWQTSVGLPFFQITGTVVEWDECAHLHDGNHPPLLTPHRVLAGSASTSASCNGSRMRA